jgi:hypothetical protein
MHFAFAGGLTLESALEHVAAATCNDEKGAALVYLDHEGTQKYFSMAWENGVPTHQIHQHALSPTALFWWDAHRWGERTSKASKCALSDRQQMLKSITSKRPRCTPPGYHASDKACVWLFRSIWDGDEEFESDGEADSVAVKEEPNDLEESDLFLIDLQNQATNIDEAEQAIQRRQPGAFLRINPVVWDIVMKFEPEWFASEIVLRRQLKNNRTKVNEAVLDVQVQQATQNASKLAEGLEVAADLEVAAAVEPAPRENTPTEESSDASTPEPLAIRNRGLEKKALNLLSLNELLGVATEEGVINAHSPPIGKFALVKKMIKHKDKLARKRNRESAIASRANNTSGGAAASAAAVAESDVCASGAKPLPSWASEQNLCSRCHRHGSIFVIQGHAVCSHACGFAVSGAIGVFGAVGASTTTVCRKTSPYVTPLTQEPSPPLTPPHAAVANDAPTPLVQPPSPPPTPRDPGGEEGRQRSEVSTGPSPHMEDLGDEIFQPCESCGRDAAFFVDHVAFCSTDCRRGYQHAYDVFTDHEHEGTDRDNTSVEPPAVLARSFADAINPCNTCCRDAAFFVHNLSFCSAACCLSHMQTNGIASESDLHASFERADAPCTASGPPLPFTNLDVADTTPCRMCDSAATFTDHGSAYCSYACRRDELGTLCAQCKTYMTGPSAEYCSLFCKDVAERSFDYNLQGLNGPELHWSPRPPTPPHAAVANDAQKQPTFAPGRMFEHSSEFYFSQLRNAMQPQANDAPTDDRHTPTAAHPRMTPFNEFGGAPKDANGNLETSPYVSHVTPLPQEPSPPLAPPHAAVANDAPTPLAQQPSPPPTPRDPGGSDWGDICPQCNEYLTGPSARHCSLQCRDLATAEAKPTVPQRTHGPRMAPRTVPSTSMVVFANGAEHKHDPPPLGLATAEAKPTVPDAYPSDEDDMPFNSFQNLYRGSVPRPSVTREGVLTAAPQKKPAALVTEQAPATSAMQQTPARIPRREYVAARNSLMMHDIATDKSYRKIHGWKRSGNTHVSRCGGWDDFVERIAAQRMGIAMHSEPLRCVKCISLFETCQPCFDTEQPKRKLRIRDKTVTTAAAEQYAADSPDDSDASKKDAQQTNHTCKKYMRRHNKGLPLKKQLRWLTDDELLKQSKRKRELCPYFCGICSKTCSARKEFNCGYMEVHCKGGSHNSEWMKLRGGGEAAKRGAKGKGSAGDDEAEVATTANGHDSDGDNEAEESEEEDPDEEEEEDVESEEETEASDVEAPVCCGYTSSKDPDGIYAIKKLEESIQIGTFYKVCWSSTSDMSICDLGGLGIGIKGNLDPLAPCTGAPLHELGLCDM